MRQKAPGNQLQDREEPFLRVLELGIYGNARSPYRRLLVHAGYSFEDVKALVRRAGPRRSAFAAH